MADSQSTAPQRTEGADPKLQKARDILSGIPLRIDPARLKMRETHPGIEGGQGIVVIGTLSPPEASKNMLLDMKVAVKKLKWNWDDLEESAKFFKSFVNEISLMASLYHPNVIMLIGFVEDMKKGDAWMILPWEGNGNVREFLQSGEWDIPERISLIQDVAKGLEYLHGRQPPICHGDLKSFNILVNSSYHAVITDFGSARIRRELAPKKTGNASAEAPVPDDARATPISPKVEFNLSTMELTLTGPKWTLRWTAPEVFNGEQDLPSDMWALGWVCWEIVTGKIPFEDVKLDNTVVAYAAKGKLPAIREDTKLLLVLQLCSIMSDCWLPEPAKRIDASTFQLKVSIMVSDVTKSDYNDSKMAPCRPSSTPSGYSTSDQKVRSAHLLLELGKTYNLQSDRVVAESYFRSAVDVATRTKNHLVGANAVLSLGRVLVDQSRYLEAEKAFTESHQIHSRIGNDQGTANALNCLGDLYIHQSRYREAEKAFAEAHHIHSRIGDDIGSATALFGLGEVYGAQSRFREAEKAFMEAHHIHSRISNDMGSATALQGLGKLYQVQSRYREAEKTFTESKEIYSRIGNDQGTANALLGLGYAYGAQRKTSDAEMAFNDAQAIYLSLGDSLEIGDLLGFGNTLHGLAMLYSDQCRYDVAEQLYRRAAALYEHADASDSKARTLSALSEDLHTQRRHPEAEEAANEALAIWISICNDEGQADALLLLTEIFKSQSRSDEEKEALLQAEAAFARIGRDAARAATLGRLGDIHFVQGTYDKAEQCYRLVQAILSSIGDVRGEATALLHVGGVCIVQDRYDEAEECFADAHIAYAKIGDVEGESKALDGLEGVHALQNFSSGSRHQSV